MSLNALNVASVGQALSLVRCYSKGGAGGAGLTTVYNNDDVTTDIEYSVGARVDPNPDQLKWNIAQDPAEADAIALQQAIVDCVDAGGQVSLTWDNSDGSSFEFLVTGYAGPGPGADMLLSGEIVTTISGQDAGKVGSFARADCSLGGAGETCEAVRCKGGKHLWEDLVTGLPLTADEIASLEDCPEPRTFQHCEFYRTEGKKPGAILKEWTTDDPTLAFGDLAGSEAYIASFDFASEPTSAGIVTSNVGSFNDSDNTPGVLDIGLTVGTICTDTPLPVRWQTNSEGFLAFEVRELGEPWKRVVTYSKGVGVFPSESYTFPCGITEYRAIVLDAGGSNFSPTLQTTADGFTWANDPTALDALSSTTLPKDVCIKAKVYDDNGDIENILTREVLDKEGLRACPYPQPIKSGPEGPMGPMGIMGVAGEDGDDASLILCNGPFAQCTGRTGWLHPWTPIMTANSGTVIDDWVQISTAETSPDCPTDMTVNAFLGDDYVQLQNARLYLWKDVRLLVNGAPVVSWTFQTYRYEDERGDTNNKLLINADGSVHLHRFNVPAGSAVTVETRRRYNANAFLAGGRARTIGGLRAHANVHFSPRNIVIGAE